MKRIKFIFISTFLVVAIPVAILLGSSYTQLKTGAQYAYREHAYLVLQMSNQKIHNDLAVEEQRSYSDYRFIRTVPVLGGEEVTISPLAEMPVRSQYPGIIGYFQLFADGSVQTPVLPDGFLENIALEDRFAREKVRKELKSIIQKLDIRVQPVSMATSKADADSSNSILNKLYEQNLKFNSKKVGQFETRIEQSSLKETFVFDVESARMQRLYDQRSQQDSTVSASNVMVVKIEPFQATFNKEFLVFYRNVTRGNERFIQGFVVRIKDYFEAIVKKENIFEPQSQELLLEFATISAPLFSFGERKQKATRIFEAPLQYPLDKMLLFVNLSQVSSTPGEWMILLFGVLLYAILGGGMFAAYRLMQGQVQLAMRRQNFISAVSHELKTPLTAIRMYAEMLQNSWIANEEKRKKYYSLISSETERLSRLIQNVLNLSKLDRNGWNVQIKPDNPKHVLDAFVSAYGKNIENNGFDLTVSCDINNMNIPMDRDAIMQILMNLVDNSLKFAKNSQYKMIELRLTMQNDDIYFAVRDYGPGIPSNEMTKVFDEFYRVEDEMTRRTKGTGIGLSMVKKLCALTNMRIEMENANPGLRTKIHFTSISL